MLGYSIFSLVAIIAVPFRMLGGIFKTKDLVQSTLIVIISINFIVSLVMIDPTIKYAKQY